jgi:penicillin-binding protein 1A
MWFSGKRRIIALVLAGVLGVTSLFTGIGVGLFISGTSNIANFSEVGKVEAPLPSKVYDRNGVLIGEYFKEKRETIYIEDIPKHLIYAIMTREDKVFYQHFGMDVPGLLRAILNNIIGGELQGASTITQQIAGLLYADRTDISITRKLNELFWAFQLERNYSKDEILQLYLNYIYFGLGSHGIEAAAETFLGRKVADIDTADSVMLAIQIVHPEMYNPYKNPNGAKKIQNAILKQMVSQKLVSKEEATRSFDQFWINFDWKRPPQITSHNLRFSKADHFLEYVRKELEFILSGQVDYYTDGLTIHTTLDLAMQEKADQYLKAGLEQVNKTYQSNTATRSSYTKGTVLPLLEFLNSSFDMVQLRTGGSYAKIAMDEYFQDKIYPVIGLAGMLSGNEGVDTAFRKGLTKVLQAKEKSTVAGAMVCIENGTGNILALADGGDFKVSELIRAAQAQVPPGSSFKPLYYTAAIENKKITAGTTLFDKPIALKNEDGSYYTPKNWEDKYSGVVTVRYALANSLNVPALQVLEKVGFEAAIRRAASLLGITDPQQIALNFPRGYPLGLGISSVSPLQMARAYSIFASGGREVNPQCVLRIEDRNGKLLYSPSDDNQKEINAKGARAQVISPQVAYVMTNLLTSTVQIGTLLGQKYAQNNFNGMPMAGKTGTTQNWSDGWTIGFSPYYTTAIWYGFDTPGNSLGTNQTGAMVAGPVWGKFMSYIHQGKEIKQFPVPDGIVKRTICTKSGMLPTGYCDDGTIEEIFIAGTEPTQGCLYHISKYASKEAGIKTIGDTLSTVENDNIDADDLIDSYLNGTYGLKDKENTDPAVKPDEIKPVEED